MVAGATPNAAVSAGKATFSELPLSDDMTAPVPTSTVASASCRSPSGDGGATARGAAGNPLTLMTPTPDQASVPRRFSSTGPEVRIWRTRPNCGMLARRLCAATAARPPERRVRGGARHEGALHYGDRAENAAPLGTRQHQAAPHRPRAPPHAAP